MGTAQENWSLENAKGAIRFAEVGLTTLVLVNGVAATVLLNNFATFKEASAVARLAYKGALMAFSHGVLAAVVAMIMGWAYQRIIARTNSDVQAAPFLVAGFALVLFSAGEFANGLYLGGAAIQ